MVQVELEIKNNRYGDKVIEINGVQIIVNLFLVDDGVSIKEIPEERAIEMILNK